MNRWLLEEKEVGSWVKYVREFNKYKLPVSEQLSYRDEMYNMENIVNNTVIILYDSRWQPDLSQWSLPNVQDNEWLLCTWN